MNSPRRSGFGRFSRVLLLGLATGSIAVALGFMYAAFRTFVGAEVDEPTRRYVAALALVAGALLVLALFCVGVLLLRYLTYGLISPRSALPTEYVNAWDLAGRRTAAPDKDELEALMGDEADEDDQEGEHR